MPGNQRLVLSTLLVFACAVVVVLYALRWEIAPSQHGAFRLDRWTGSIVECKADVYKVTDQPFAPAELKCTEDR
jgi:hypothetical protein